MALNGIDVASYQAGLNPAVVPCDFIIVKATEGTSYVNPDFYRMADAALKSGKLLGIYHYAAGGNQIAEADHFLRTIRPYMGKAILWLDWERDGNAAFGRTDLAWCRAFLSYVKKQTGITCGIYMSKMSGCRARDWSDIAKTYPLWGAQYANNDRTGYQSGPWTDSGSWGAWPSAKIFQYSSHGRLANWNGNLDLDLCYMSPEEWMAMAKGTPVSVSPPSLPSLPFPDKTDTDLAVEVWFGVYGSKEARREVLGSRYDSVQQCVGDIGKNVPDFISAEKAYMKKFGCDKLIEH